MCVCVITAYYNTDIIIIYMYIYICIHYILLWFATANAKINSPTNRADDRRAIYKRSKPAAAAARLAPKTANAN